MTWSERNIEENKETSAISSEDTRFMTSMSVEKNIKCRFSASHKTSVMR
jgi:hypothetical protein